MRRTSGYDWLWRPTRFAIIYDRDGGRCLCCGLALSWSGDRNGLQLDHLVPTITGGTNKPENLVTLCRECNGSKRNLPLDAWCDILALRGIDVDAFKRRIAAAVAKPIDATRGRELCELYCPGWLGRKRAKDKRRRTRGIHHGEHIPF